MTNQIAKRSLGGLILKWIARIAALIFVAVLLLFMFSEGPTLKPGSKLRTSDYFVFSMWGIYAVGLLLGLKWEILGGLISSVTMAAQILLFTLMGFSLGGARNWIWAIFFAPGILYLLSGTVGRRSRNLSASENK